MPDPYTLGPGFEPIPPPLPLGPLGIIIGIVEAIMRLFGFGQPDLKPVIKAVNNTWANLAVGAAFLYNALGTIYDFIKKLFSIIYNALKHIISDILHGHLLAALHDIQKLFKDLKTLFQPILDAIAKLRGWYYKYIFKWVRRVQNVLSIARAILAAFRILGAKWAAKLDADIQRIQAYITQFTSAIVGTLNQVSTWLNIILDPVGVFRPHFLNNSLFGTLGAVKRAGFYGANSPLTATEQQSQANDKALVTSPTGMLTPNADGSVTLSDASKELQDGANAAIDYYGRAPVPH